MKRWVLVLVFAFASSACSAGANDRPDVQLPDRPDSTSGAAGTGTDATADTGAGVDHSSGANGDGSSADQGGKADEQDPVGEDDLKVFAYATADETALAAELADLTATVGALEGDLQARDLDAAEGDAHTLLEEAEALEADATDAGDRQRPLEPQDADLSAAHQDALDAFGTTAAYASSATDIANVVLAGQLADLPALLQEAASLAGTGDDLTQAYADLNAELTAWAQANPAEAARALATYGA